MAKCNQLTRLPFKGLMYSVKCEYLQGGLKAVIWTDVFQAGIMLVGILIIVIQVISCR